MIVPQSQAALPQFQDQLGMLLIAVRVGWVMAFPHIRKDFQELESLQFQMGTYNSGLET